MTHRVELVDFSAGRIWCRCGAVIDEPQEPLFDRNDRVADAFREHRYAAGLRTKGVISYDHDGPPKVFRVRQ